MVFVLLSMILMILASVISALIKNDSKKTWVACLGGSVSAALGIFAAVFPTNFPQNIVFQTNIPNVSFAFGMDPLSRFFLIVILGVSLLAGIYGVGYIKGQKKYIATAPFFPLLVAAMTGVVVSRDGFSFLILWEIMALVSFFLVTSDDENKEVQNAGWIYLIASHLGTAFLMAFFVIMAKPSGSFLFADFAASRVLTPLLASVLFLFAVIGFGTKAGIFPLHVWLPHAHPAAPGYISAVMSGVMIKTGIYGILRAITFLGAPPLWWGGLLVALGIISAVLGVLYAIMQHDLKRLLAYHSVENIGIIVTGIGLGLIGVAENNMLISVLGFGGAIFHTLNHAIFKSLLFLCAGSIAHSAHSLGLDRLGGLIKKMPLTGVVFLVAAMSICGLPPFNGFISEWLIYIGLFGSAQAFSGYPVLLSVAGVLGIAFAGGLAVACFTKVFGVVFLGEPRSELAPDCHDPSWFFNLPMILLAACCVLIGIFPQFVWPMVFSAVQSIAPNLKNAGLETTLSSLNMISLMFALSILLATVFMFIRKFAFRKKTVEETVTWDCGYAVPTAHMQYTAASFAEPIGTFFSPLLNPSVHFEKPVGIFPKPTSFEDHVDDYAEKNFFDPLFNGVGKILLFIRKRKKSTVQSYLTLIFIVLIVLFVLEVWFGI